MTVSQLDLVEIPGGPFLLGACYDDLPDNLRRADQEKVLGLGAVLASTPPRWVDLPAFSIMPKMVSNGEYQAFWEYPHPDKKDELLVDDIQIWEYVWQLYTLRSMRVPSLDPGTNLTEDYGTCQTAIGALVRSYAYEAQRILFGHHIPPSEPGFDDLSRACVRVFAALRRGLGAVVWTGAAQLERGEQRALTEAKEDTPESLREDVDTVIKALEMRTAGDAQQVPLLILLRRLRYSLVQPEREDLKFRVSELFRPLVWPDEPVPRRGGGLFQQRVPWEELPVRGITLYEAAAYAAWLRLQTGLPITLPSEAEYEKAFGWSGGEQLLRSAKFVYPWQGHNEQDFNYWFSRDGMSLQALEARPPAYRELMDSSARLIDGKRLFQGLGFGWQWTRERFNELERKYNRFEHAGVMKHQVDGETVCEYKDCVDLNARFFAVRGAPDQLGGPGTVTRRFALNPLRGYGECGFRCVASEAGAM